MSIAHAATHHAFAFPTVDFPARGRCRASIYRSVRLRHIRCAYLRKIEGRSCRWIARKCRVSVRTVTLWVRAALGYTDPEAQALRDLLARGV